MAVTIAVVIITTMDADIDQDTIIIMDTVIIMVDDIELHQVDMDIIEIEMSIEDIVKVQDTIEVQEIEVQDTIEKEVLGVVILHEVATKVHVLDHQDVVVTVVIAKQKPTSCEVGLPCNPLQHFSYHQSPKRSNYIPHHCHKYTYGDKCF